MARINVIDYQEAEVQLKAIYDNLIQKRGKLADIHKIPSLRPESVVRHMELYLDIMFGRSPLSRAQREMISVVVSAANGCQYCTMHHLQALSHYVKDEQQLKAIMQWPIKGILKGEDAVLCDFALHLTKHPGEHENTDFTESLRNHDFTDEGILDTVLVIAYFNFVNRIALSLGLHVDENEMKGYTY